LIVLMLVLAGAAQTWMQSATEVLPAASVICPARHASHAAPPGSALYSPAGQARQASGGPEKPALHWQASPPEIGAALAEHIGAHCEALVAPLGASSPMGHASHTSVNTSNSAINKY